MYNTVVIPADATLLIDGGPQLSLEALRRRACDARRVGAGRPPP